MANSPQDSERNGNGTADGTFARHAIAGSTWSLLQTVMTKGLAVVVQVVLARLLLPSDWGLLGIATGVAASFTILSPKPIRDLLVQRGRRIANAIPNTFRLSVCTSLITAILITSAGVYFSLRPGTLLRMDMKQAAVATSTFATIESTPPLEELLANAAGTRGSLELLVDGAWVHARLPDAPKKDDTLASYATQVQAQLNAVNGVEGVSVLYNESASRLQIFIDGEPVAFRSWSTATGAALGSLGVPYRSMSLLFMIALLALIPIIETLRMPFGALLQIQLRFGAIAAAGVIGATVASIVSIFMAFSGAGPYALLPQLVVFPAVSCLVVARASGWPPRVQPKERESVRSIARDSSLLWLAQWAHTSGLQTPFLILGLFVASQEVGYIIFALGLSAQIVILLSYNLSKSLTPIFSNLQDDPERLASGYMRSVGAIAAISAPLFVLAATMTPVFIPVIFGEQWIPAIGLTSILMIAQAFATTNSSSMSLLKGSGRFKMYFAWQVSQTAIFLPAVALACWQYGVVGLAWAVLVEHIIFAPLGIALCVRGTAQARGVLRVHVLPLIACIPLVPIAIGSLAFGANWYALLLYCPTAGSVGLLIYVIGLRALDRPRYDDLAEALGIVLNRVRRFMPGEQVNPS